MGITIRSKRYSGDMGYGSFNKFRNMIAFKLGTEFFEHYTSLNTPGFMVLEPKVKEEFYQLHELKTQAFIDSGKVKEGIIEFLYQSDCEGSLSRKYAKEIYELIKDDDDEIVLGYPEKKDCAKMLHMKQIFSDKTKVYWN